MKKIFLLLALLPAFWSQAQKNDGFTTAEVTINPMISGTLYTPEHADAKTKLVIVIAGSGPTDRNGNQYGATNNSLKLLSEYLAQHGTAIYAYDKRILALAKTGKLEEKDLSFQDFIADAQTAIDFFKAKKNYAKVIVAGHSEGSLIGMVAANGHADGYISISGAGRSIDQVIMQQLDGQPKEYKDQARAYFDKLAKGETFKVDDPSMMMLFRETVQPYMISWIKYDPKQEIAKLKIPVLLVNGTKDLQVAVSEAELLKAGKPDARLEIIPNMNHVLKTIKNDEAENAAAYNNPDLPIDANLAKVMDAFIKSI